MTMAAAQGTADPEAAERVRSAVGAPPRFGGPPLRPGGAGAPLRRAVSTAQPRRRFIDSVADYAYVPQDLRRIALLTGTLVVLVVALSLLVR